MLTDTALKRAPRKNKPYNLSDDRGLFVVINPDGRHYWRLRYTFAGKRNTLSLGVFPDVSLASARLRRDDGRRLIAQGIDPALQRKEEKLAQAEASEQTFRAVAERWRELELAKHANPDTAALVWRRLELNVLPYVGDRPIASIKIADVMLMLDRIRERGADVTARRVKLIIGQVCRFAIRRGLMEHDPTYALRGEKRAKAKSHAAFTKPDDVARFMAAIRSYRGSPIVRGALALSALLFQRPGEIRRMEWSEIDFDAAEWSIPATKMKMRRPHVVPLSEQAIAILHELQPLTGHGLGLKPDAPRYVFPGARSRLRPLSENALRQAMRTLGFSNDKMTPHGFRAMARTMLDEILRFRPDIIEHQLSHEVLDPNGRAYNRTSFLDERRRMMQAWADYLDSLQRGDSKVTPLRAA